MRSELSFKVVNAIGTWQNFHTHQKYSEKLREVVLSFHLLQSFSPTSQLRSDFAFILRQFSSPTSHLYFLD